MIMSDQMISESYSIARDRVQWILTEHYKGKDKSGGEVARTRNTYHSNLKQVAKFVVDNNETHCLDDYIAKAELIKADIESLLTNTAAMKR